MGQHPPGQEKSSKIQKPKYEYSFNGMEKYNSVNYF